jgi:hypothetical protein
MGNSLADHSVCESYVGDSGKSKKAEGLLAPHSDHCRKIAIIASNRATDCEW